MYIVFNSENEALEAEEKISKNMNLNKGKTIKWANPFKINFGKHSNKWVFSKPDDKWLIGIDNYEIEDDIKNIFFQEEIID